MESETKKRRAKGEGALFKVKENLWRAEFSFMENGRRKRVVLYGRTQDEARRKLTAEKRKNDQRLPVGSTGETVGSYLDKWLVDVVKNRVRPATYEWYEMHVRVNIRPDPIARQKLEKLSPADVRALMNRLAGRKLSPRSIEGCRATLRTALNTAIQDGRLAWNAAQRADPHRQKRPEVEDGGTARNRPKFLTPEQAKTVLDSARDHPIEGFLWAALGTGARSGELLGLRWEDLDLDGPDGWGTMKITGALRRIDGGLRRVEPKSKSGVRTVDLAPPVVAALRRHRARQLKDRVLAGADWQDTGLVFTTSHGTGMDTSQAWEKFQQVLKLAGLQRFRVHDLRHSAAAFMISRGVSPRVVMENLGHSSITLTLGTYGHALAAPKREAAAALAGVIAG